MNHKHTPSRHRNILTSGLLVILLSLSTAQAASAESYSSRAKSGSSLGDDHSLGFSFGIGFPLGWLATRHLGTTSHSLPPNISLGTTYGYAFSVADNAQLIPEIGIRYGFTKKLRVNRRSFKESSFQIPFMVGIRANGSKGELIVRQYVSIGYELDIALFSHYVNQSQTDRNLLTDVPGFSRFSGSIVVDERTVFPLGIFFGVKFRFPLKIISVLSGGMSGSGGSFDDDIDVGGANAARLLTTSVSEFYLGLDIMELL